MTQADALAILKTGTNVFLTGEPGAGKSYTVRQYVTFLQSRGVSPAMTASTGIAATHIGGMTIHSWSGLGIRKSITRRECQDLGAVKGLAKRIKNTNVLIIDEISMLDAPMLDAVDLICRYFKNVERPFGGIQVVFVGDFFQLPPVTRYSEPTARFAFTSNAWMSAHCTVCYLSEQHRQEDAHYLEILSALRRGEINDDHRERLHNRHCLSDDHEITKLYSHNADVDQMNSNRLHTLKTKERTYEMFSQGNPKLVEQIKRGCLSPEKLILKIGARVMFTRNNLGEGYVNGSIGDVVNFDEESTWPIVRMKSGRTITVKPEVWSIDADGGALAAVKQVPLRLAWAITVHKSQGMSLDSAYIDLGGAFAYGQGYVALSRVRTLAGLFLGGLNARALEIDPDVLAKDQEFRDASLASEMTIANRTAEERAASADAFIASCGGNAEPTSIDSLDGLAQFFPTKPPKKKKEPRWFATLALILEGKTIQDVAKLRGRTVGTIIDHLIEIQEQNKLPKEVLVGLRRSMKATTDVVHPVMKQHGSKILSIIFDHFKGAYSYDDLKIAKWLFETR